MDTPTIEHVTQARDVARLLETAPSGLVLLFKHSTQCPVSARAHEEFLRHAPAAQARGVHLALVRVIEERPLSQDIARRTGIAHESPQALLLSDGKVVWHANHRAITAAALEAAEIAQASA